jgi:hypothetical protein
MSSTGTVLDLTAQLLNYFGLERHQIAEPNTQRLSIEAAVFRAVTGKTPNAFLNDTQHADLLIATNETVQEALRWISAVLSTDAPHDPDTGIDDHLEHIRTWVTEPDFFTHRLPELNDVIGVLLRAKQAADTLTDIPHQRPTAA